MKIRIVSGSRNKIGSTVIILKKGAVPRHIPKGIKAAMIHEMAIGRIGCGNGACSVVVIVPVFIVNPENKFLCRRIKEHLRPFQIDFSTLFVH
ncbi:hypothetical protein D1872_287890 [compost metagenome]